MLPYKTLRITSMLIALRRFDSKAKLILDGNISSYDRGYDFTLPTP